MWRTIGTELGVDVDILNTIGKDNTDDGDCLIAVIDSAAPTREIMANILKSANISNAIAGMIKLPPPSSSITKAFCHCKSGMGSAYTMPWLARAVYVSLYYSLYIIVK